MHLYCESMGQEGAFNQSCHRFLSCLEDIGPIPMCDSIQWIKSNFMAAFHLRREQTSFSLVGSCICSTWRLLGHSSNCCSKTMGDRNQLCFCHYQQLVEIE